MLLCAAAVAVASAGGCNRGDDDKVQVDLTTPRSAATVFTRALEAGDVETAKSAAYAGGVEIEWVEAMAQAMSGMRKLMIAAQARFGAEAQSLVAGRQTLQLSGSLGDAEVQMNGDRATVIPSGGDGTKLPMKRIDGNWKIDVGLLTRGEDITSIVKQLRVVGMVTPQMSKDVEAGKFQSIIDVRRAITKSVVESFYDPAAATRPTTNQAPSAPLQEPLSL